MKYLMAFLVLASVSACGMPESMMDRDAPAQTYVIDHSDYIGQVYWQ